MAAGDISNTPRTNLWESEGRSKTTSEKRPTSWSASPTPHPVVSLTSRRCSLSAGRGRKSPSNFTAAAKDNLNERDGPHPRQAGATLYGELGVMRGPPGAPRLTAHPDQKTPRQEQRSRFFHYRPAAGSARSLPARAKRAGAVTSRTRIFPIGVVMCWPTRGGDSVSYVVRPSPENVTVYFRRGIG
jgi:hypothetical protein